MKILKIFFLICILSYNHTQLKAQNDKNNNKIAINKLIFKADSLKEMGQLNYSINKYIKALKMDSNYAVLFYKIASAYALLKKKDSAFIFLEKTIKIDSSVNYLTNPDYFYLINEKKWDSIKKIKIEHFIKKDSSIKDINLAIKLWEIKLKDQSFYYFIKIDTANANRYWEIKDSINNKNIKQIDEIINNYGWPKISVVGKDASLAVFLVIQHANLKYQKKFLPILENAIKRNEANKSYYAYLVDRINICENKKQIYGTQLEYNFKTKSYYFNYNTIIDSKNIDKRRAEMGLNSIEEYLKTWNLKWMPPK